MTDDAAPRPPELCLAIDRALRAAANPERAEFERGYLKVELECLGGGAAGTRGALREALGRRRLTGEEATELAERLWEAPVFERRAAAALVLRGAASRLVPGDLARIERLLRESGTWALVDNLAVHVAGPLVERYSELGTTLDRWSRDGDFWIRRSSLLALLLPLRRGEGDFARFGRYADRMLEEKQFFVRKAIGWVLREVAKKRPELVRDWLAQRTHRASGVTVREAVRYLPEPDRERLMSAYREGRPSR